MRRILVGLGLVAMAMLCLEVKANGTFTFTLADYNSAQVAANNYVVTVPEGSTVTPPSPQQPVYYDALYTLTSGTELEANSHFTITLPTGFTFATTPALCFWNGSSCAANASTLYSGGTGFQAVTFTITNAVTAASGLALYIYPAFQINNTSHSLGSQFGGSAASLSVQATGNAVSANNDAAPVSQPAFAHAVGSLPDTISPGGGQIDLAFPYYGNQFVPGGIDGKTAQGSGSIATFAIDTETNDPFNGNAVVLNAAGGLNTLVPGDSADITIDGFFNGIGQAYATATAGVCQTTIPSGATVGTVTNTTVSFTGIPINTPVQMCIIPDAVMWEGDGPYVFTYQAHSGVTDFFGGLSQTTAGNFYTYSPSPTITVLGGTPQHTHVNTAFGAALSVKVTDASSNPLVGINVLFAPPYLYGDGPSASFAGGETGSSGSNSVGTNASGIATTGTVTANSIACNYVVKAKVGAAVAPFYLQNVPTGVNDLIFCQKFE